MSVLATRGLKLVNNTETVKIFQSLSLSKHNHCFESIKRITLTERIQNKKIGQLSAYPLIVLGCYSTLNVHYVTHNTKPPYHIKTQYSHF